MIKQTWDINTEEKLRILNLHENATKKMYLMGEQEVVKPVQGPGDPNLKLGQDENYEYFVSQPTQAVGTKQIEWSNDYFVYASDGKESYVCQVLEVDDNNKPKKVKVLTERPLPNVNENEFLFIFNNSKDGPLYEPGSNIVKNAFMKQGREERTQVPLNKYYYGVVLDGLPITVQVSNEGPTYNWMWYQNNNEIFIDNLEKNSKTLFNPFTDVFVTKKGAKLSRIVPTLVTTYSLPEGFFNREPEKPNEIPIPTPPESVPFGDKFEDNVSTPNQQEILSDPKFAEFKKFVDGNDMSKFVFDIQSSASKCTAGYKESNKSNGKWKDDVTEYPDVTVDSQADKNDLGNLNLTKARAQNLKNFLVTNIPKLKDAKFRVIAQGSKGICGTEEENKNYRRVDLTVTKL